MKFSRFSFAPKLGFDVTGAFGVDDQSNVVSEEDELQKAIQMSLMAMEKPKPAQQQPPSKPG